MIAGISAAEYDVFWVELLAWGMQMMLATLRGSREPSIIAPLIQRHDLAGALATGSELSPSVVTRAVDLLTLDLGRCSDAALTPLVPIDGALVPMSSSIVYTSPQRNLLAIVQSDPALFGEAGRLLGLAGEAEALEVLGRLQADTLVAKRINVVRPGGQIAGDFDVVVCDPVLGKGVVLEIKWGISTDGNSDVYKAEQAAIEKRAQVIRLRKEVRDGEAAPRWPRTWPDASGYDFRWYVLTRDVLATRNISDDDVTIRSVQLLSRTLRQDASLVDLINALDNPPTPPSTLCETRWQRFRYGDVSVELELIVS